MPSKIFINYRRGDDPGFTQALLARLEQAFSSEQLFMDVDSIPAGTDFVHILDEQVAQCDILLAVVGKNWIEARDETGARRLDSPDDFVRLEIESALKQGKRVIPVLVHDARMPRADELPQAISGLARRHAVRLTHERFRSDAHGLVKAIQHALEEVEAARQAQIEEQRRREEVAARAQREAEEQHKREEDEQRRWEEEAARARLEREAEEQHKREEGAAREQRREAEEQHKREEEAAREQRREAEEQRRREEEAARERARLEREAEEHERREREKARLAALAALSPEQIVKAEELANWEVIKDGSRVQDLRDHLARFPGGVYERIARQKLSALAWVVLGKAPDRGALKAYLEEFPDSIQAEKARARLARLSQPRRVGWLTGGSFIIAAIGVWFVAKNWPPATAPVSPQPEPSVTAPPEAAEGPLTPERERALRPNDIFKECAACPEMIVVPAGSFAMGSPASEAGHQNEESPQHSVSFAKSFAVARFAVTFEEWDACAVDGGCNGYRPADQGWGRARRPVINVSWSDAESYVSWLSRKTGRGYRLLSEPEREYVTRAGTTTPFWWGSSISTSDANYDGNHTYNDGVEGESREQTVPVDAFKPNPWGLYQVHGNIWEWTQDCYQDSYNGAPADGSAWTSGDCSRRVARGGSWGSSPEVLRSAYRIGIASVSSGNLLGFRVARTLTP
jgi:formylglycine-generating enzyme required for sulfatase activity